MNGVSKLKSYLLGFLLVFTNYFWLVGDLLISILPASIEEAVPSRETWGRVLGISFIIGMIRQPYGSRIIPLYINPVQKAPTAITGSFTVYLDQLTNYLESIIGVATHLNCKATFAWPHLVESSVLPYDQVGNHPLLLIVTLGILGAVQHNKANSGSNQFPSNISVRSTDNDGNQMESIEDYIDAGVKSVYGYVRQSMKQGNEETEEQDKDSIFEKGDTNSAKNQKANIADTAAERGLSVAEFFSDINASGFSMDRDGLNELFDQLETETRPIVLDRIDRLGRNLLETIYVAAYIHFAYGVPIITAKYGEYDFTSTEDQLMLAINAYVASKSVEHRMKATWEAIMRNFTDEKRWKSWFNNVRVGFSIPDRQDDDWVKPVPGAGKVISAIMHDTIILQTYSNVADLLTENASQKQLDTNVPSELHIPRLDHELIEGVFEPSDIDLEGINGSTIKKIVTDPIYIGEVRYPRSADEEAQSVMEDENLAIVDQDLFNEVNEVIEDLSSKNSYTKQSVDTTELADLGLLAKAVNSVDDFKPVCEECGQGMVKNGSTTLSDGTKAHYYICPNHESDDDNSTNHPQRKFPRNAEWNALKSEIDKNHSESSDVLILRVHQYGS